jgi:hypothetical protein
MKASRIISIIFMICIFVTCQTKIDNVVLTDFTKELILMYINDSSNLESKKRKDDMIVISHIDTLYYCLSVFANNGKEYKFCREDFVGQASYMEHSVKVYGNEESIFYSVSKKIESPKKCGNNYTEYDPSVWEICLYKDKSFCKMRTYKVTAGEDSLRHFISSNFQKKNSLNLGKTPVAVSILIDKNGKGTFQEIIKSSGDAEIDSEAVRVTEMLCKYNFIPATHRGQKVNAIYPVLFFRDDVSFQ